MKKFSFDERILDNLKPAVRKMGAYTVIGGQSAPVKLNQNENPFDVPGAMKREVVEKFLSESWNRYPDVFPAAATERIARFLDVPTGCVIVSNGSNELIYTLAMATLSRGTSVLIPSPTFSLYEKVAELFEADVLNVSMTPDLEFDIDAIIEEAQRSRPRLVILSTPNNPTSKSISVEAIERIASEVRSLVVVDEAYIEFSRQQSALPLIYEHSNVIVLRTLSKAFALAGVRLGYLVTNPRLAAELLKPKIPFTTNRLAELMAVHILDNYALVESSVKKILDERTRVGAALKAFEADGLLLKAHESDANFFIIEVAEPQQVFDALKAAGVLVRNVSPYPMMEKCLRVGVGTPEENDAFLNALKKRKDEKRRDEV